MVHQSKHVQIAKGGINLSGMFPCIEGFDEMPDLKHFLNESLQKSYSSKKFDPQKFFAHAMEQYNELLKKVNSKLPRQYGVMLNEIKLEISNRNYQQAIDKSEYILTVFPQSIEAQNYKDEVLINQNRHPFSNIFSSVLSLKSKEKSKILDLFREEFRESSPKAKSFMYTLILAEMKHEEWQHRYAAIDLLKSIIFLEMESDRIDDFIDPLVDVLCDDEGKVRQNAIYCISSIRGRSMAHNLFCYLSDIAQEEKNAEKQKNLCRAILELVSPMLDKTMELNNHSKKYRQSTEFALKITGYDQTYYRMNAEEKMMYAFTNRKRGKY